MEQYSLQPGLYRIGDPVYMFSERTFSKLEVDIPPLMYKEGTNVVVGFPLGSTGCFRGSDTNFYPTDTGFICISHESIVDAEFTFGTYEVEIKEETICKITNGIITFGHITIDTNEQH